MEQKNVIDLTKILEGCEGIELYCIICGKCKFLGMQGNDDFPIMVEAEDNVSFSFNKEGKYWDYSDSECLLFPSKDQRDWSKFKKPLSDLPIDTPCMVSGGLGWQLRNYAGSKACYADGETSKTYEDTFVWPHIIPVDKFNFTDLESNFNSEWNYGTHKE